MKITICDAKAIENFKWPDYSGPINGFKDKNDVIAKLKNPVDGLTAFRILTENVNVIHFYPEDIISCEIVGQNGDFPVTTTLKRV